MGKAKLQTFTSRDYPSGFTNPAVEPANDTERPGRERSGSSKAAGSGLERNCILLDDHTGFATVLSMYVYRPVMTHFTLPCNPFQLLIKKFAGFALSPKTSTISLSQTCPDRPTHVFIAMFVNFYLRKKFSTSQRRI